MIETSKFSRMTKVKPHRQITVRIHQHLSTSALNSATKDSRDNSLKAGDRWTENEATEWVNLTGTENFKNNLLNTCSTHILIYLDYLNPNFHCDCDTLH